MTLGKEPLGLNETLDRLAPGTITTIAGAGLRDGVPAREADAGWPLGVVRRPDGDLIVTDYHAHILWRIDAEGMLHRFAGDGVPGDSGDGGPAIDARFDCPHDLAQDKDGNLFLSDLCNQTYRRIDYETGIVTRVAGSGETGRGGDGGPALEAEMDTHCGIAIDDDGNLYLSSEWANNIRRVDAATGIIELFAGRDARHHPSESGGSRPYAGPALSLGGYSGDGGPKEKAAFQHPEHLAFDSKGDLYVCDNSNNRIRKIDMKTGIVTTVLGTGQPASNGDGGPATEAGTLMPDALCFDVHDNMYVGEKYGFRVRRVDAGTGIVTTIVGTGEPGMGEEGVPGPESTCNSVEVGLWADPDGTVFFADCGGRLRRYDGETGIVTTVLGGTSVHDGGPATEAFVGTPSGIAAGPDGQVYFADSGNQRIRGIDPETGVIRTVAGNGARAYGGDGGPATEAYLGNPGDVSVDSQGRVVIADTRHGHVRRVDADGTIRGIAGAAFQWDKGDGGPAIGANLVHVQAVAHDADDNVYIGDAVGRIRRIDASTGTIGTVAGVGLSGHTGDGGPAVAARIGSPSAIRFDGLGNMYFSDSANHVVRRVDTEGTITTVIGTGEPGFSPDGASATRAKLDRPGGLAVGPGGELYVSDTGNDRVRVVAPDGTLRTVAGSSTPGYSGDGGPATNAGLNSPSGLWLLDGGVLLISDHFNHRVRAVRLVS
jgi:sugar lactone lactonase YvrE